MLSDNMNMNNMNMNNNNMNNNNMNMGNMFMSNMNMNNMYMNNNNNNMNNNNMNMNNMNMNMNNAAMNQQVLTRLSKEFQLCLQDNDLIQIGCNFGLENNNLFTWRVTMIGPVNTPYDGGLFSLLIIFPQDYPNHGPEFKFLNKIYHLNVDNTGHLCLTSTNEWHVSGKVKGNFYTVKQALFDVFCLFHHQGADSAYDEKMAQTYLQNPEEFNKVAKEWTKLYA